MNHSPHAASERPASSRRQFLRTTGGGLAGASLLTMLEARQAPAQIKGTTLRILQWSHFIPAYDTWFDNTFTKAWGDKNGVKVRVDHIPHLELPARMAAEYLGARARRGTDDEAQGPSHGHPVLSVRGREPQLALGPVQLRRCRARSVGREHPDRLQGDARGAPLRQGAVRRGHDARSVLVGR